MNFRQHLLSGLVIPAHPLALTPSRELDERHQRALTRYYVASGAGGMAVGVHTTQFEIRQFGLYRPVLELAAETADAALQAERDGAPAETETTGAARRRRVLRGGPPTGDLTPADATAVTVQGRPVAKARAARPFVKIAGLAGDTRQAMGEAEVAASLGYHAGLLSLAALGDAPDDALLRHCRAVAETLPLVGFYLQPAVGGRLLDYRFWREFAEIANVVAIKIAPFNRYQTIDVVRAVAESGREDIALYTGNDDSIVVDLLTPFPCRQGGRPVARRIVGGLLGQWAVWTRQAVALLDEIKALGPDAPLDRAWLARAAALTDANGALFDVRNAFAGCIVGIHEVLRRQGLMRGVWTLDPRQRLEPDQAAEIDRVLRSYPELTDDEWVAERRDEWLRG
jgi:dihydrodipicolinate synthase/N-acetylneuraminate lyase